MYLPYHVGGDHVPAVPRESESIARPSQRTRSIGGQQGPAERGRPTTTNEERSGVQKPNVSEYAPRYSTGAWEGGGGSIASTGPPDPVRDTKM